MTKYTKACFLKVLNGIQKAGKDYCLEISISIDPAKLRCTELNCQPRDEFFETGSDVNIDYKVLTFTVRSL